MSEILERLKVITENLAPLGDFVERRSPGCIEYEMEGGETTFGFHLYRKPGKVAVQRAEIPAGGRFPEHYHADEDEILVPYRGSFVLTMNGRDYKIGPGEAITIHRGASHSVYFPESTSLIGITVPDSVDYPDS